MEKETRFVRYPDCGSYTCAHSKRLKIARQARLAQQPLALPGRSRPVRSDPRSRGPCPSRIQLKQPDEQSLALAPRVFSPGTGADPTPQLQSAGRRHEETRHLIPHTPE